MKVPVPGIYQRGDGTVYWLHEDGRWQYWAFATCNR